MPDKVRTNIVPVGVIGGTGFYNMKLEEQQPLEVETPYGICFASCGFVGEKKVVFIARHGTQHGFLPHEVNYRANVYALKKLGASQVFAFCMAGTLSKEFATGDIVIPRQFIDLTTGRSNTFFGEGNSAYVSMADPFCPGLSSFVADELSGAGLAVHRDGTYVCVQGPHFSTRAESRFYSGFGDLVGMTAATEAKLAREARMCYTVIASVVDRDTCSMGMKDMRTIIMNAQKAAKTLAGNVPDTPSCQCGVFPSIVNKKANPDQILNEMLSGKSMFGH